jgi:UDPglucose 6-dehydrogenase
MRGKKMKISVIGMEQSELISGKSLAEMGNEVIYVCKDYEHVNNIKKGYYTHTEKQILEKLKNKNRIDFTADLKEALDNTNMCFIAENDKYNVFNILANAKEVGANMSNHTFVVDRSELPVNRREQIKETIQEELNKRGVSNLTFEVISDPRFLRA